MVLVHSASVTAFLVSERTERALSDVHGRPFQPPEPRPLHDNNKILHQSEVGGQDLRRSQLQSMKAGGEVEVVVAEGESEDE
jgi:hypothetical protein